MVPRRRQAAVFLMKGHQQVRGGADLAAKAGSPVVKAKEPGGWAAIQSQPPGQEEEAALAGCSGPHLDGGYLFMHRASPQTCARVPAAHRALP
jgi:hypothetical protein